MKLRFNRHEMAEALAPICTVAGARTTKPVLQCVRLEARPDVLLLSATDLELALRCSVTQVEVNAAGETLVTADTVSRIVRECEDEVLDMELKDNMLHLRGAGSHFQVVTQDPADFPALPTGEDGQEFIVPLSVLRGLIEWTSFASARESTRYAINGVLWEIEADRLTLAATDGRRLALANGGLSTPASESLLQAIVPTKALSLFGRLPGLEDTPVGVSVSPNQLILKVDGALLSTSLVEGNFPRYQDVIPKDCDREVSLNTKEFTGALKRAALLTSEESRGVRLSFSDGNLTLSSRAPEQGEATISLAIRFSGEPLVIGFNPIFLLEVLRITHSDEITFSFKDPKRPGIIQSGDSFLYVVMPVNLDSA